MICDAEQHHAKHHRSAKHHNKHRHPSKFLTLSQFKAQQEPWDSDGDTGFTYGEHTSKEAEDPSDYSVSQFLNTDDGSDTDDEDDSTGNSDDQDAPEGDFGADEVAETE